MARPHPILERAANQRPCGGEPTVEKNSADQRFTNIGENRHAFAAARGGLADPEPDMSGQPPITRHLRAGFASDEIGQALREFALFRLGVSLEEHFRDHKAKNAIA